MRRIFTVFLLLPLFHGPVLAHSTSDESYARICVTGPRDVLRVDAGRGTPAIDIDSLLNPAGGSEAMCCGSCNEIGDTCENCVKIGPYTTGCAGVIKACGVGEVEVIVEGQGSCAPVEE